MLIPEGTFPLATERLLLRRYEPGDLAGLYALSSSAEVTRWLYWGPRDEAETRTSLELKLRAGLITGADDNLALALVPRDGGEYLGEVCLVNVDRANGQGELGYMLLPGSQRRGYATEAARALLGVAFGVLGLHRVYARIEPRNGASARTLERLGMRQEAHFVENEWVRGEWQSEAVYAMLAAEWAARGGA